MHVSGRRHTWQFPLGRLVPLHFQPDKVAQRRHIDESQLAHFLHVGVRQVLNSSDSQTGLGADYSLEVEKQKK